jgi:DNA polymerase-3 subunit epsilon
MPDEDQSNDGNGAGDAAAAGGGPPSIEGGQTEAAAATDEVSPLRGEALAAPELGARFERFASTLTRPVVFFDIEATGTDPLSDRIVEISLVRVVPGDGVESARTWRVNPGVKIPAEAIEIHGISNEAIADAPPFERIASQVADLVGGADLAGFAIGRFDVRILHAELVRAGRAVDFSQTRVIDAQVIYHRREPRNLAAALGFYRGKELAGAHGAHADTVAALEVFAGQLERYPDLDLDIDALHELSATHNDAYCDLGRRFAWRDNEPTFNFGRLRGKSLRWVAADPAERKYLRWFLEGNFDEDAKSVVREALTGRIRRRKVRAVATA